jgi:hypothetical protein
MYDEQTTILMNKDEETIFPNAKHIKLPTFTPIAFHTPTQIKIKEEVEIFNAEYEAWRKDDREQCIIWTWYDEQACVTVVRALRTNRHEPQIHMITSNQKHDQQSWVKKVINSLESKQRNPIRVTTEMPEMWETKERASHTW